MRTFLSFASILLSVTARAEHFASLDLSRAAACEVWTVGYRITCLDERGIRVVDTRLLEKDGWLDATRRSRLETIVFMAQHQLRLVAISQPGLNSSDYYVRESPCERR